MVRTGIWNIFSGYLGGRKKAVWNRCICTHKIIACLSIMLRTYHINIFWTPWEAKGMATDDLSDENIRSL
jgi:hypothetical protein